MLPEPSRIDLTGLAATGRLPDLTGDGLLVIPQLEHWFLRERNGLHTVRSLLSQLARTERRCLIGCDSWAWRFIVEGASANLALPRPHTFEPFDARRLRDGFANWHLTATASLQRSGWQATVETFSPATAMASRVMPTCANSPRVAAVSRGLRGTCARQPEGQHR